MTTHMNVAGRPALAPLWTSYQNLGCLPTTTFRAAQAPLLSPSPMSPKTLPSPMYPTSHDGSMRNKDRALVDSLNHNIKSSGLSSPKSVSSIGGQSPLVSRLEEVSLQLTDTGKSNSHIRDLESPLASQENTGPAQVRHRLQPWEDFGNMKTANVFVIARSLRRHSSPQPEIPRPALWQNDSSKSEVPDRLTLRAIIRPKAPGRQPFLIQRTLDVDELRVTASPSTSKDSHQSASPSKAVRKPLPVPSKWSSNSRRPSTGSSLLQAERASKMTSNSMNYEKLIRDPKTVPIHLQHIVAALPALATLLTSGHVQKGDIIYLPVPHAESWSRTVCYLYTGHGELTAAMRENILYLGGRV
ncbi:hypothetical protein HD806DRAFT_53906 [Xylariaceae sp. AK1471]|nr:hypothetical protein HD806DRAFT_53906 [Xylariaceae sp. AK1471]